MKTIKTIILAAIVLLAAGCSKNNDNPLSIYSATVTFKPQADGSYFLKEDEKTALVVLNKSLKDYPFSESVEKRALVQYGVDETVPSTHTIPGYDVVKDVTLLYMDTLFTKAPVAYDPEKEDTYGHDSVGIYLGEDSFPPTIIEDGYLNICFAMPIGISGITHTINLLTGTDPADPYLVEFRHNSNGDPTLNTTTSYACFPLKDLPDTEGQTVKLTLKWRSLVTGQDETASFDYCSRTDW